MFDFFRKLFSKESFGLSIDDRFVRAVQVEKKGKDFVVKEIGQRAFSKGVIKDGFILDQKALAKEILTLLKETKPSGISSKNCYVSFAHQQVFEDIFYIPKSVEGRAFKMQLEKLIESKIPLPFHELKYEYRVSFCGELQIVSVVAAKREVISQYYQVIKDMCGLNPLGLEPSFSSLMRNIDHDFCVDKGSLLVDFSEERVFWFAIWQVNIFDSHTVIKSHLDDGSDHFTADLKRAVGHFENITKRKIEKLMFTGEVEKFGEIRKEIEEALNMSGQVVSYKVDNMWPVVVGTALRGYERGSECLNFFKKRG